MNQRHAAYTLLEVMIAGALLAMTFGLAMQAVLSMRMFYLANAGHVLLQDEARLILNEVLSELSSSAWHIPLDEEDKPDLLTPGLDRGLQYYPYVMSQTANARGDAFRAWHRSGDDLVHEETWSAADPPDAYHLPSHEVVFVKVSATSRVDHPSQVAFPLINLNDTSTVVPFSAQDTAPYLDSMDMETDGTEISDVRLRFERDTTGKLREYGFVVVRDAQTGEHQLQLRFFHRGDGNVNGTGATEAYRVLSNHVDRLVVETSRTHPSLSPDQLRATVYMSNTDQYGHRQQLVVTGTVAMRSTVDPEYSAEIDNWLGTPGQFRYDY